MKKSCGERKARERKLKVDVGSKCMSQGPLRQLQPDKTETANTYQTPYFDIRPLSYAWNSTGSPSSPSAGHAYTDTLIKFKQRTKNDTKNTQERLTQCRSLSSLFASFPAPHVSQSLLFTVLFPKAISKIARLARLFLQLLLSSALDSSDSVERLADKGRRYKRNGRELNS